jgi:hypothetical protein
MEGYARSPSLAWDPFREKRDNHAWPIIPTPTHAGKTPFDEIKRSRVLLIIAKGGEKTKEKCMTSLLYQRIKFQELMYYLHYLPGFYPSVEPRHDEAGNSWTRHSQQKAGTLVSLYFNR